MNQGIWAGMIAGGTGIQTIILAVITIRCDWDKEVGIKKKYHLCNIMYNHFMSFNVYSFTLQAEMATKRMQKWGTPKSNDLS